MISLLPERAHRPLAGPQRTPGMRVPAAAKVREHSDRPEGQHDAEEEHDDVGAGGGRLLHGRTYRTTLTGVVPTDVERAVKIGVLLDPRPADLGRWLTEAAAFDAAGADVLWVDVASGPELDPPVLTAALAAVTYRALLVMKLPVAGQSLGGARALATIGQLSRGRLRIADDNGVVHRIPADPEAIEPEAKQRWTFVPVPDSRATWRARLRDAAEHGTHGVLVPADPRLLDLLRNPEDPGERRDLLLAQG